MFFSPKKNLINFENKKVMKIFIDHLFIYHSILKSKHHGILMHILEELKLK